jgi:hypothetical protein
MVLAFMLNTVRNAGTLYATIMFIYVDAILSFLNGIDKDFMSFYNC